MLRGYRHFIFALVGFLSLAAQHPNAKAESEQAGAQDAIADSLHNIATTYHQEAERAHGAKPETDYCGSGQYESKTDLCAQWKAADAAADAARWTYIGNWIGGISGLLVIGALGLAFQSNSIAHDSAKRQLRAYISVTPKGVFERNSDGWTVVPIFIENHGQTPAYGATVNCWFEMVEEPRLVDHRPQQIRDRDVVPRESAVMFSPGTGDHVYISLPFSMTPFAGNEIAKSRLALVHSGVVRYRDAFDKVRYTYFSHYHRGEELSDVTAMRSRFGNDAT